MHQDFRFLSEKTFKHSNVKFIVLLLNYLTILCIIILKYIKITIVSTKCILKSYLYTTQLQLLVI